MKSIIINTALEHFVHNWAIGALVEHIRFLKSVSLYKVKTVRKNNLGSPAKSDHLRHSGWENCWPWASSWTTQRMFTYHWLENGQSFQQSSSCLGQYSTALASKAELRQICLVRWTISMVISSMAFKPISYPFAELKIAWRQNLWQNLYLLQQLTLFKLTLRSDAHGITVKTRFLVSASES